MTHNLEWKDISVVIRPGMVRWPGSPPVEIERLTDMERGDPYNMSSLRLDSHTGTHIDAPLHFIRGGAGLDEMPLDATVGIARVIEIKDPESIKRDELEGRAVETGERLLFKTRNSDRDRQSFPFEEDYVYVAPEAAQYLAGRKVRAVGVDYLSVSQYGRNEVVTHRVLLEAGVWVIENLDLSGVEAGTYELVCLPLRLEHCDGAPARAIIRPLQPPSSCRRV